MVFYFLKIHIKYHILRFDHCLLTFDRVATCILYMCFSCYKKLAMYTLLVAIGQLLNIVLQCKRIGLLSCLSADEIAFTLMRPSKKGVHGQVGWVSV